MEAGPWRFALCRPQEQQVLLLGRQLVKGPSQVDLVAGRCQVHQLVQVLRGGPGSESAIEQRLGPVSDHLGWIEVINATETVTFRAGAVGAVEREGARLELGHIQPAVRARHR